MGMLRNGASRTRKGTAARSLSMFPATLPVSALVGDPGQRVLVLLRPVVVGCWPGA